ncbi:hypothetical protein [Streptomyces sp. NPDC058545]|uniref:hypothetical protein n=1 Tax=Streptomyces sp. NPDC058545 TaxID=3346544 RepID=UPI00364F0934
MNVFLRIVAGAPAGVFLLAGSMKVSHPPQQLATFGLGWAEDFRVLNWVTGASTCSGNAGLFAARIEDLPRGRTGPHRVHVA